MSDEQIEIQKRLGYCLCVVYVHAHSSTRHSIHRRANRAARRRVSTWVTRGCTYVSVCVSLSLRVCWSTGNGRGNLSGSTGQVLAGPAIGPLLASGLSTCTHPPSFALLLHTLLRHSLLLLPLSVFLFSREPAGNGESLPPPPPLFLLTPLLLMPPSQVCVIPKPRFLVVMTRGVG